MFDKPQALLFLKSRGFQIYSGKDFSETDFDFSEQAVSNLEVLDIERLKSELKSFLESYNLKPFNLIVVLSEEVLFKKTLTSNETQRQGEVESFLNEIPLDPEKIAQKIIKKEAETIVIATNRNFFSAIKDFLETNGWKIEAVVPVAAFGDFSQKTNLGSEEVREILDNGEKIKNSNFLSEETRSEEEKKPMTFESSGNTPVESSLPQKPAGSKKQTLLLSLGVVLIIVAVLIAVFGFIKTPWQNFVAKKEPEETPLAQESEIIAETASPSATTESTPSAKVEPEREKIKIQILNGTGVTGQAAKVKSRLEKLGYKNIQAANAQTSDFVDAEVSFGSKVEANVKNEISADLKKFFVKVVTKESSPSAKFDVSITTGKESS